MFGGAQNQGGCEVVSEDGTNTHLLSKNNNKLEVLCSLFYLELPSISVDTIQSNVTERGLSFPALEKEDANEQTVIY